MMKRVNYNLPEDLIERIKAYSAKTGMPMSEAIRRAVVAYLDANPK